MTVGDLIARIGFAFDPKGLKDAEKEIDGFSGRVGSSLEKAGQGMMKFGSSMTKFVTLPLLGLGAAILKLTADAEAMEGKFNQVFGSFGEGVVAELDAFAEAAGRGKFALRGMASEFGDILKPLGFTQKLAAKMSVTLTKMAVDASSFSDVGMDEALERIKGTLIGAHENATRFGVVINENTLKAELAARGWDELTGKGLELAKVQARITLLTEGLKDAQGDAIRTAGEFNNQVRDLQGQLSDLAVELGRSGIIDFASDLVVVVTDMTKSFAALEPETKKTIVQFGAVAIIAGPMIRALGGIAVAVSRVRTVIVGTGVAGGLAGAAKIAGVALAGLAAKAAALAAPLAVMVTGLRSARDRQEETWVASRDLEIAFIKQLQAEQKLGGGTADLAGEFERLVESLSGSGSGKGGGAGPAVAYLTDQVKDLSKATPRLVVEVEKMGVALRTLKWEPPKSSPITIDYWTLLGVEVNDVITGAVGVVQDFTGMLQHSLSASGPWGAALAGGLELLKVFGLDLNKIVDKIVGGLADSFSRQPSFAEKIATKTLDEIADLWKTLSEFLGESFVNAAGEVIGPRTDLIEARMAEAIDAMILRIGQGLEDIVARGEAAHAIGLEYDINAEKLKYLQEIYLDLATILPENSELLAVLRGKIEQLGEAAEETTAILEENIATGHEWGQTVERNTEATKEQADALDDLWGQTTKAIEATKELGHSLEVIIETMYDIPLPTFETHDFTRDFIGFGEIFNTLMFGIGAEVERLGAIASALGLDFDAAAVEADLLAAIITDLINKGLRPGNALLDALIKLFEIATGKIGRFATEFKKFVDDIPGEEELGFVGELLADFAADIEGLGRVLEVTGDAATYWADAIALAEAAQRGLLDAVADGTLSVEEAADAWQYLQDEIERFKRAARSVGERRAGEWDPPSPAPPGGGGGGTVTVEGQRIEVDVDVDLRQFDTFMVDLADGDALALLLDIRNFMAMVTGSPVVASPTISGGRWGSGDPPVSLRLVDSNFNEILTGTLGAY